MAIPPASYYENPYLPTEGGREDYQTIPLYPVEAHSILAGAAGRPMSPVDRLTLQCIADEDGDDPIDFLAARKRVIAQLDTDDDWD